MKPVMQIHTVSEHGWGDCLSACLASVLELSLEDVPQFSRINHEEGYGVDKEHLTWMHHLIDWLKQLGYGMIVCNDLFGMKDQYVILGGASKRTSHGHSVVARITDEWGEYSFVHDPHPEGVFLDGDPKEMMFLVKTDCHSCIHEGF